MKTLTWPDVAVLAVLGGVAVALAVLTPWDAVAVVGLVAALGGLLAGKAAGQAAAHTVAGQVDEIRVETAAQTVTLDEQSQQLATVAKRVNGELDERIEAAMDKAIGSVMRELQHQGLLTAPPSGGRASQYRFGSDSEAGQ